MHYALATAHTSASIWKSSLTYFWIHGVKHVLWMHLGQNYNIKLQGSLVSYGWRPSKVKTDAFFSISSLPFWSRQGPSLRKRVKAQELCSGMWEFSIWELIAWQVLHLTLSRSLVNLPGKHKENLDCSPTHHYYLLKLNIRKTYLMESIIKNPN